MHKKQVQMDILIFTYNIKHIFICDMKTVTYGQHKKYLEHRIFIQ